MPENVTKEEWDALREDVKKMLTLLTGNGEPERGIIIRLDRIEQWRKQINWGFILVGGAVILNAGQLVWDLITHAQHLVGP